MAVQTAVDVLARMLDAYESGDRSVHHVGATTTDRGSDVLHVDLEVPVPLRGDGDRNGVPVAADLSDDGRLAVEFPTEEGVVAFPSPPEADVSTAPQDARVSDGEVLLTLEVTIAPTGGDGPAPAAEPDSTTESDGTLTADGGASPGDGVAAASVGPAAGTGSGGDPDPVDGVEAARNDDLPPYEDTDYLRAIYGRCDTFSEMREVIEMDVSTETVRRYMIDAGVHDPSSYETAADGPAGGGDRPAEAATQADPPEARRPIPDEKLVTDGIGLPDDLSLEDVLEAVVESSTVYEVTRTLELDQRRTREILEHLDLLELVMHRVSDDRRREVTYEDVADRLRRVAATA